MPEVVDYSKLWSEYREGRDRLQVIDATKVDVAIQRAIEEIRNFRTKYQGVEIFCDFGEISELAVELHLLILHSEEN